MLAQTSLAAGFRGPDVLHEAPAAGDAVDNPGGLAIQFPLDLNDSISSSCLHHSGLDHKITDRASSRLFVTFVHSIQTSLWSVGNWSWDPGSDQECSQVSPHLVSNKGRGRENFFEVRIT